MIAPEPANHPSTAAEAERLAALRDLVVLDSAPEPLFDQLARLASQVCGTPVALLSLVDAERQWFKANVGLPGINETPLDVSFCAHAIRGGAVMVVPDASTDPRFAGNPLVTGAPGIRFYAGAPLVLPDGAHVGTLCVIDRQPRALTPAQRQQLQELAGLASEALVMRRNLITRSLAVRTRYEQALAESEARYRAIVEEQDELVSLAHADGTLLFANTAYARHFGRGVAQLVGTSLYDYIDPADRDGVRQRMAEVLATGQPVHSENRMLGADGRELWVAWTNQLQRSAQGAPLLHSVGRDISDRRHTEAELQATQAFLTRTGRVAGVGGWELDLQTQVLRWSDETRRIHGVGAEHVPSVESAIDFYAPQARPVIEAAVQRGLQSGEGWDLELPFVNATGAPMWVRAVGEVEFEQGQPRRLVGALQDVTERRQLQQRLAESERFVRLVTDSLPMRLAYIDRERRYRFVNHAHTLRFGRLREDILGRTRSELTQGRYDDIVEPRFDAALAGRAQQFDYEDQLGGEARHFQVQLVPDVDEAGQVRGLFASGIDVTDRVAAEAQLQRQTATLLGIIEALPAVVAVMEPDGRFRFVNSACERWVGRPRDDVVGLQAAEVLGPAAVAQSAPWVARVLAGETVSYEFDEATLPGPRGVARHLVVNLIPLRTEQGSVDGYLSVMQDVTQHKQETVRLLQLAQRDPLTGLLNRRGVVDHFARLLAEGEGAHVALLCLDLDHFKPVNDQHGHLVGDQLLQTLARRLTKLVRPSDAVARLGGDEFAVLLTGVREDGHARTVADKIIQAAAAPVQLEGLTLQVGVSVGLAFGAAPGVTAETAWAELLARADSRLYEAKAAGRGCQVSERQ